MQNELEYISQQMKVNRVEGQILAPEQHCVHRVKVSSPAKFENIKGGNNSLAQ